ncbi:MAG: hypothetical protein MK212_10880 [Saprospiraceae bacterium]|nr:hypothetical protein [Saprospiraceae bacterium]
MRWIYGLCLVISFYACDQGNNTKIATEGADQSLWGKELIAYGQKACENEVKTSKMKLPNTKVTEFCACAVAKMSALHPAKDIDLIYYKQAVGVCKEEAFLEGAGTKGAWTTDFKERFTKACLNESYPEQETSAENKQEICICFQEKLAENFPPDSLIAHLRSNRAVPLRKASLDVDIQNSLPPSSSIPRLEGTFRMYRLDCANEVGSYREGWTDAKYTFHRKECVKALSRVYEMTDAENACSCRMDKVRTMMSLKDFETSLLGRWLDFITAYCLEGMTQK